MIKLGFFPVDLGVAVRTLAPQRTLVGIVFAVAGIAFQWRITKFLAISVALFAIHLQMFGAKCVVCLRVVELLSVKVCHLGFSALVVGVASSADLRFHPPMKPDFLAHVDAHILVASHAQTILRFAIKPQMAVLAFVFGFAVPGNQLAWRNDGFDSLCVNGRRAK